MKSKNTEWPVVPVERLWEAGGREETVTLKNKHVWRVTDLIAAVADQPIYEIPLAFIDLRVDSFDGHGGLLLFAQHMLHCMECDTNDPIILDEYGCIIDGRHRLVKALIDGQTTIKAKKLPPGISPSYHES